MGRSSPRFSSHRLGHVCVPGAAQAGGMSPTREVAAAGCSRAGATGEKGQRHNLANVSARFQARLSHLQNNASDGVWEV